MKSATDMSQSISNHGDLMDGIYRYQRHFYDATRKYYLLGRDRMILNLRPPKGGTVLEIGCGTGRNLVAVGKTYADAKLYGFDISTEMLATAQKATTTAFADRSVTLAIGDATNFNASELFGIKSFDRIFLSYSISMIPDWQRALDMAFAALAPGGQLHIVDFGNQKDMPRLFRFVLMKWLALFHVAPRENLEDALQALARCHHASFACRNLFRGYSQIAIVTRAS
jgi:S-adenosylmethionine-diacylgycerolhomoserine-N-methlytransferase